MTTGRQNRSDRRNRLRAFTLVEMLVVMAVALTMMTTAAPIFTVTTRNVRKIEEKLAVYEAARNLLDYLELDIQQAAMNERGEHFSLKKIAFQDTDPFTPAGVKKFYESRREADAIHYFKHQAGGLMWNGYILYPGGMPTPLAYPHFACEGYQHVIRSGLDYNNTDQNTRLADVSQIESYIVSDPKTCAYTNYPKYGYEPEDFAAAGHEVTAPNYQDLTNWPWYISGYRLMDIDFAYWDDVAKQFAYPPDGTAIYFAPAPKAIRAAITVCDFDKRSFCTFTRVIVIPCGVAKASIADTRDSVYYDSTTPAFNRTKDLHKLDIKAFGLHP